MKKSMNKSRKKWNVSLAIGTVLILAVVIVCIVSFIYMPHDPIEMNTTLNFLRPGANESYILGTDNFGRDILSRIMMGSRTVFIVGVVSTAFGAVIRNNSRLALRQGAKIFVSSIIMSCLTV